MMRAWLFRRNWSLAVTVLVALAVVLLPLGMLAAKLAVDTYRSVAPAVPTALTVRQAAVIMLPLVMWLVALGTGWLLANRLVVGPLTGMRREVERYAAGDVTVRLAGRDFASQEMTELSRTFDRMADAIDRHDTALRAALDEQKRLTREVHHRVKNNLQIVASLLSIQSRETSSAEVARAYGTVQARVNALALVHRWMYDGDPNDASAGRGVDLKALVCDLCASLERHLATIEGIVVQIRCEIDRGTVSQDHAVPVAFLITELAGVAASEAVNARPPAALDLLVKAEVHGDRVKIILCSPVFGGGDLTADPLRPSSRIVHGMARQLRTTLQHEPGSDCYSVDFALTRVVAA